MKCYLQNNIKRSNFDKDRKKAEVGSMCSVFLSIYKEDSTG